MLPQPVGLVYCLPSWFLVLLLERQPALAGIEPAKRGGVCVLKAFLGWMAGAQGLV